MIRGLEPATPWNCREVRGRFKHLLGLYATSKSIIISSATARFSYIGVIGGTKWRVYKDVAYADRNYCSCC